MLAAHPIADPIAPSSADIAAAYPTMSPLVKLYVKV